MVLAQSVDWDDPESVPVFIQAIWPRLPDESKRKVHHQLRPFLPGTAEMPSSGNIGPTIQTATSSPGIESMSASSTPSHLQGSSCEPEETVTTLKLPAKKSTHASKPSNSSRRTCRQLPCASGQEPSVSSSQETCARRSGRVVPRKTDGRLPSVPLLPETKDPTKNLPDLPAITIAELCQYSKKTLQSPYVGRDISDVARQLPEPYSHLLFSVADYNTKITVLEYAEAFFSNRGHTLRGSKDIVEKQQDDKSLVRAATIALRIHSMAVVCLRDHLVEATKRMSKRERLLSIDAKRKIVEARCRHSPHMEPSIVKEEITEELDHGAKYVSISQQFSMGLVPRLNHKCPSRFESRKLSDELKTDLREEGAKPSKMLEDLARNGNLDDDVILETLSAGFFLSAYYHHHLALFPEGCGGQDCHWRAAPASLQFDWQPSSSNFETIGNESNAPFMLAFGTATLAKYMALLLPASDPANDASLGPFLSRSPKRMSCSDDWLASVKKQKNASNSRSRTPIASAQSPSTTKELERRHDGRDFSISFQSPTDANCKPHLDAVTTGDAIHDSCPPPSNEHLKPAAGNSERWDATQLFPANEPLIPAAGNTGWWDATQLSPANEPLIPAAGNPGWWDATQLSPANEPLIPAAGNTDCWDVTRLFPANERLFISSPAESNR